MKVIFLQHVRNVAQKGEIKEVSPGYFQNFLAPQRLAMPATDTQVKHIHNQQAKATEKLEAMKESADAVKAKIQGKTLTLSEKASETGKLFAAVHSKQIVAAIKSQLNVEVPEKNIEIEAIKTTGVFPVHVKLYSGLSAHLSVNVTPA